MASFQKHVCVSMLVIAFASWNSRVASFRVQHHSKLATDKNTSTATPTRFETTATKGSTWPLPQSIKVQSDVYTLVGESKFMFTASKVRCDILDSAFARYFNIIFFGKPQAVERPQSHPVRRPPASTELGGLDVQVENPCSDYPTFESDESYTLVVSNPTAVLIADSIWGALRGLETFSQIIYESHIGQRVVNKTSIIDYPRFKHRGYLVDTSLHYLSVASILKTLDAMAYNKLNVFHWHIVDDTSFPYESAAFPSLSQQNAFDPHHVYTRENVKQVIEYARLRGIRVLSEFDTPAHTESWVSIPGLLTPCYEKGKPNGLYGPINPILEANYDFLRTFFQEVVDLFPDKYAHMGGDEVDFDCWESNPNITAFMKAHQFGSNYSKLEEYYEQKLLDIMAGLKVGYAVWQEIIDDKVTVPLDTIVQVWKEPYPAELDKVTAMGYRTLLSSPWYLNYVENPYSEDWKKFYHVEPTLFDGTDTQKALIIGGEICMWGEYVDSTNVIQRTWPRASAAAERLWSAKEVTSTPEAEPRLIEHRCRMVRRGLQAEPVTGPGFCQYEYED